VRYLVSGSVQRSGNLLRVTAQLIDTSTNVELWSLKLDRTIEEVFTLQDQIAQRVAQQLDATVQSRSADYARYGTDAYLAFLKGRALIESRKVNDVEASIQQFSRAVELAPSFAVAIAELARAKLLLMSLRTDADVALGSSGPSSTRWSSGPSRSIRAPVRRIFYARCENSTVATLTAGRLTSAKVSSSRPTSAPGCAAYADDLIDQGRHDEALEQLDRARLVEPLSAENHYRKAEVLRRDFAPSGGRSGAVFTGALGAAGFLPCLHSPRAVRWLQAGSLKLSNTARSRSPSSQRRNGPLATRLVLCRGGRSGRGARRFAGPRTWRGCNGCPRGPGVLSRREPGARRAHIARQFGQSRDR